VQEELEKMLAPLVKVLPKEFQEMNFFIADDKNLNAFAMPGGNIVLNRGLLEKADSDIEVLGVVAHEMAHVTQRHVLRSMIQGVGIFLLIQTMLGDMTGLIAVLGDQGSFLLSRSFSRDMETEADKVGFQYLMAAKIPPEGLIAFFKKIILESEKVLGKELSKVNISFLSTHPDTEKRISEIENMIKREKSQFHYKSDYLTKIKTQLKGEK
jgi:predicted Zn-dependent protease